MKQQIYAAITVVALTAGCSVKTSDDYKKEADEIIKKTQEDLKRNQEDVDRLISNLFQCGQPGVITVKGIVVKKADDQSLLDDRITVEQKVGKGNRGGSQAAVAESNKAVFSESVDNKDFVKESASNTFINLGCKNLSAEETSGLTEEVGLELTDSVISLFAKKIFVCGPIQVSHSFMILAAEQIVLKNAAIKAKTYLGTLSLNANNLVLEGESVIETEGLDNTVDLASSLNLTVAQTINGEGKLVLRSTGGSCIEKK